MRVVSLLPSATETLCAIGGRDMLVGRSHECDWPPGLGHVPVLTAARTRYESAGQTDRDVRERLAAGEPLYELNTQLLARMQPDVILTQDLCRVCSIDVGTVQRIAAELSPPPRVISLNPQTLEDVLEDLITIGRAVGLEAEAERALMGLRSRLYGAAGHVNPFTTGPRIAFLEWTDALFIGGHWTPQLIERAGALHPLNPTVPHGEAGAATGMAGETMRRAGPSLCVPAAALVAVRPEAVIICPCGLDLTQTREAARALAAQPWWDELPAVRDSRVALVDGNQMFNRPGPRLVDAFEWLVGWLNDRPEVIPPGFPWEPWPG